jgi:hypothetical protein
MSIDIATIAGARLARVPATAAIAHASDLVIPAHEIAVITGEHGTGKTTALARVLADRPEPVTTLTLPPRQTSRDIVRWLHDAVITSDDLPERDLQDDLAEALAVRARIVVIEHAHRLSKEAAGQLQYLHARPGAQWSLFLVGGPGTVPAVTQDGLLREAICQTITVQPLKGETLIRALQDMHDLYLGAGTELLAIIDQKVCHGRLAAWVRFLQHAIHLRDRVAAAGRPAPVLDLTFAKAVIAHLPTTMRKAH